MKKYISLLPLFSVLFCMSVVFAGPVTGQVDTSKWSDPLSHHPDRGRVIRQFLPDTGPDSLAVSLPTSGVDTKHAYCFDATKCRLRYSWTGDFISLNFHKRDGPAKIQGDVFHRTSTFPLRFGTPKLKTDQTDRDFLGFQLIDGIQVLFYKINDITVRHRITQPKSGTGLIHQFQIKNASNPVWFAPEKSEDIAYDASKGTMKNGMLKLTPKQARKFSVTLTAKKGNK